MQITLLSHVDYICVFRVRNLKTMSLNKLQIMKKSMITEYSDGSIIVSHIVYTRSLALIKLYVLQQYPHAFHGDFWVFQLRVLENNFHTRSQSKENYIHGLW